jgi:alkylated DNA nucleotide flippase Atl1
MTAEHDRRRRILESVGAIPPGFVMTYGDIWPQAPRLAGRVLATLEDPELPWWRVVRSDGSLAVGARQRALLEAEGVPFRPGPSARVDLRRARLPHGIV